MRILAATIAIIIIIAAAVFFSIRGRSKETVQAPENKAQEAASRIVKDQALKNALNLYAKRKQEGMDFSNGPCLGIVAPDWVLDIAHNPRLPVDDEPENQCEDFRTGRVHHFIELDLDGKLIRTY